MGSRSNAQNNEIYNKTAIGEIAWDKAVGVFPSEFC